MQRSGGQYLIAAVTGAGIAVYTMYPLIQQMNLERSQQAAPGQQQTKPQDALEPRAKETNSTEGGPQNNQAADVA
ncbi:unnamed protein product [Mycena citricolor]|uniref:Uncharacterized protein n=1 Tax=Mycena citricolor TaxID=2018698 RepID=A0AAD2Q642_9AGAR|nr:unnamed protein product [Mycena citricolor]